jgi:hypothetical protein
MKFSRVGRAKRNCVSFFRRGLDEIQIVFLVMAGAAMGVMTAVEVILFLIQKLTN